MIRVGLGYDVHAFVVGRDAPRPLVLAGVTIGDHAGLAGHSDADVVAHAVADALLGAAGLGDLGTLYPAEDDRWQDADSMLILRDVVARITAAGWSVGNVDVVVNAEQPKLNPHVGSMRANLGAALGTDAVSVKPKRGEGLDAVGRSEGVVVYAVVLLEGESLR